MKRFFSIFLICIVQIIGLNAVWAADLTFEERKIKELVQEKLPNNYIENTYQSGGLVIRWNKALMPIKIYVENNPSVPYYYDKAFIRAVAIWNRELRNIVQVVFVEKDDEADISFKVIRREKYLRELKNRENSTLAYTTPEIKGNRLKKMTIYLYDRDLDGKLLEPYMVLNIAVHEFGHAMGIAGHPLNKNSIMYALFDPRDRRVENFISREDRNTLYLLYMIEPDITNGDKSKETGTIKSKILMGSSSDRIDASIKNLQKELEIMPKDCYTRVKLALLYQEKGETGAFFSTINDAIKLAKTNDEFHACYMAYAIYYYDKKDKQNALKYVNKALAYKQNQTALDFKRSIEKM